MQETAARATHNNVKIFFIEQGLKLVVFSRRGSKNNDIVNKKNIALLRACAKTGKAAGQFIEVMACEGGCITGPSTHNDIVSGRRQLAQELLKRKESYETMDR